MSPKLLKRYVKGNKAVDIWRYCTICLLPYINLNFLKHNHKRKLIECNAGWLFWCVRYYGDYKPCVYDEYDVKLWMCNYTNQNLIENY